MKFPKQAHTACDRIKTTQKKKESYPDIHIHTATVEHTKPICFANDKSGSSDRLSSQCQQIVIIWTRHV